MPYTQHDNTIFFHIPWELDKLRWGKRQRPHIVHIYTVQTTLLKLNKTKKK